MDCDRIKSDKLRHKILLVGRSGNGLTSCCNSIKKMQNNAKTIIAVECPGIGDTGTDRQMDIETVKRNLESAINVSDNLVGVSAMVHVMKYGVRFTQQEKDAIKVVKSIFGEDVFHNHGIILMSYGDLFETDNEGNGRTFKDWCKKQTGDIEQLFKEVNYRIVLFNNKTDILEVINNQFDTLHKLANELKDDYTMTQYDKAERERNAFFSKESRNVFQIVPVKNISKKNNCLTRILRNEQFVFVLMLCVILLALFLIYIIYMFQ